MCGSLIGRMGSDLGGLLGLNPISFYLWSGKFGE